MNLKFILFILLLLIIPVSNAETIVGSTMELVNGSGNFTWTSQNFPALKDGDTLKMTVINNTISGVHGDFNPGLLYLMKKVSFEEILREIFPSAIIGAAENEKVKNCVNYLTNYYCSPSDAPIGGSFGVVIDVKTYRVNTGGQFFFYPPKYPAFETTIYHNPKYPQVPEKYVFWDGLSGGGGKIISEEGKAGSLYGYSPSNLNPKAFYVKEIYSDDAEIQGYVVIDKKIISQEVSANNVYNFSYSEWHNKNDMILSEGINYVYNELTIVKNGNSVYPSADIIKRTLSVNYIPAPTSTPTPIITTPLQTPTPTITITSTVTPTSTPTVNPSVTPSPTTTQITTPTPTPTSPLEQEVKELKERLNKTEEKQSQQESRIS